MPAELLHIKAYVDGAARGNPGPSGAGFVLVDAADGQVLLERGLFLGKATNNVAEYKALLAALEMAGSLRAERIDVLSDSELLVKQMTGEYRVRNAGLRPLFSEAIRRKGRFGQFTILHIRREENQQADRLANMAVDAQGDVQ